MKHSEKFYKGVLSLFPIIGNAINGAKRNEDAIIK